LKIEEKFPSRGWLIQPPEYMPAIKHKKNGMLEDTEAMVNILILVANFIIHARILIIFRLKKYFFFCTREKNMKMMGENKE